MVSTWLFVFTRKRLEDILRRRKDVCWKTYQWRLKKGLLQLPLPFQTNLRHFWDKNQDVFMMCLRLLCVGWGRTLSLHDSLINRLLLSLSQYFSVQLNAFLHNPLCKKAQSTSFLKSVIALGALRPIGIAYWRIVQVFVRFVCPCNILDVQRMYFFSPLKAYW